MRDAMSITYEIDSDNTVKVMSSDFEFPILVQPTWPNGEAWSDSAEAAAWAELYVVEITNEDSLLAPFGRGLPGRPRLTIEQMQAADKLREDVDKAKTPEEREAAIQALRAATPQINP